MYRVGQVVGGVPLSGIRKSKDRFVLDFSIGESSTSILLPRSSGLNEIAMVEMLAADLLQRSGNRCIYGVRVSAPIICTVGMPPKTGQRETNGFLG